MVFIISQARAGSNLLTNYMNQIPSVKMLYEELAPYMYKDGNDYPHYKNNIVRLQRSYPGNYVGCKILYGNFDQQKPEFRQDMLDFVFNPNNKIILLKRRNTTEWAISRELARVSNDWVNYKDKIAPSITIDALEVTWLKQSLEGYEDFLEDKFSTFRGSLKTVYYEDLIKDKLGTVHDISRWLGVGPPRWISDGDFKKQASKDIYNRITNLEEIENIFGIPVDRS